MSEGETEEVGAVAEEPRAPAPPPNGPKPDLAQLQVLVVSAKLNGNTFLKPDVYVELSVDAGPTKRTAVQKKTNSPQWKETFTVLVCETSELDFRVYGKARIFEDFIIGQKVVRLTNLLKDDKDNGQFNGLKLVIPLVGMKESGKIGELKVALTGVVPKKLTRPSPVPNGVQLNGAALGAESGTTLIPINGPLTNGTVAPVPASTPDAPAPATGEEEGPSTSAGPSRPPRPQPPPPAAPPRVFRPYHYLGGQGCRVGGQEWEEGREGAAG